MTLGGGVEALLDVGERVLADSTHIFEDHDNRREAEELLAMCLGVDSEDLKLDQEVRQRTAERYLSLVARRAAGEPFPFLTGRIEFYGLDMKVKPGAFVPRPSSELTVARAAGKLRRRRAAVVVDVCSGQAPIAIAIADEVPHADVWALEISSEALAVGKANARRLGVRNVTFRKSDLYAALPSRLRAGVDLITGHIPYVPPDEVDDLPSEVREHEPLHTLTDQSADGLSLMRRAVDEASQWLEPGGWLLLEMTEDLAPKVRRMCRRAGLEDLGVASDDDGLSVVVEARKMRGPARAAR